MWSCSSFGPTSHLILRWQFLPMYAHAKFHAMIGLYRLLPEVKGQKTDTIDDQVLIRSWSGPDPIIGDFDPRWLCWSSWQGPTSWMNKLGCNPSARRGAMWKELAVPINVPHGECWRRSGRWCLCRIKMRLWPRWCCAGRQKRWVPMGGYHGVAPRSIPKDLHG